MKILRLSPYYYPEITASSNLVNDINETFIKNNASIYIIAPTPCRGVSKDMRKKYKKKLHEQFYEGKLIIHRFKMFKEGVNPINRAIRYLLCSINYYFIAVFKYRHVDIINIGSTPPIMGATAAIIKKRIKKPIVYNLQDIFPDSLVGTGMAKRGGVLWKIGRCLENYTYKNVDKIIVPSEDFKLNIMNKGVPINKIEVIYNWIDSNLIVPIEKEKNPLYTELKITRNKFYVVYAGNLGFAQNVIILLKAAQILKYENDIGFLIFGTGGLKHEYEDFAKKNELSNVNFFPLQPLEKVSYVYSLSDASLVACKKGLGGSAMPSKTWSILSTSTPVLCSFDSGGELQTLVQKYNLGLFSEAEDVNGLVNNILTLYHSRDLCQKYGQNGRNFIKENLTREVGTTKYLNVFNTLTI